MAPRGVAIPSRPLNGAVSNGGGSRSGRFCPFLSFLGLPRFSGIFPICPGIFPICPFPLFRPISSTYEEQSRKGPRHNPDLSRKKWETPPVWKPPRFSFSPKKARKSKNQERQQRPLTMIHSKSIAMHLPPLSRYLCESMPTCWSEVAHTDTHTHTPRQFVSRYSPHSYDNASVVSESVHV